MVLNRRLHLCEGNFVLLQCNLQYILHHFENPNLLRDMVKKSMAKSTDILEKENVDDLCDKCEDYAEDWKPVAEELWNK